MDPVDPDPQHWKLPYVIFQRGAKNSITTINHRMQFEIGHEVGVIYDNLEWNRIIMYR